MKKFLSILIVLLMCFPFIAPLSNLPTVTAQKSIEGKNVSIEKSNLLVPNINISGVDTSNIKESYVTEYYKTSVLTPKVLLTEIITKNTAGGSAWAKTFGGTDYDYADSVQQTADGGYIVAGDTYTFGAGKNDFLILKLDPNGNIMWAKTFGGDFIDNVHSINQTSDGGYIVAGDTYTFGAGDEDFLILKLNSNGNIMWAKTFGGSNSDYADSVQQTSDGGYVIGGYTDSFGAGWKDCLVLKLDPNGNITWAITIGGSNFDEAHYIQQTSDGGYIIAGQSASFGPGGYDLLIIKLNSTGSLTWAKTFRGSNDDYASSIQQTSDGGYIVAGYSASFDAGDVDFLILKLNSTGNLTWAKTFSGSDNDWAISIQQTSAGGYIIGGYTKSFGAGDEDFLILKLNSNGNIMWAKTFGGIYKDYAESIQQTSDGGCILVGYTRSFGVGESDLLILKLNSNGDIPGSSCNYLKDVTSNLIVNSQTLTITSPNPSVSMISLSSNTPTLTFTSPTFQSQTICEEPVTTIVIKLQIGKSSFIVNNETKTLDSPPVIKNSRTLLPIKVIIESLGGTVSWDATERKVTVALKDITIQLWIGKSQAKINGVTTLIDLTNTKVVPEIINSRTMLPLRFITENLGAEVIWDRTTQTVTITYQP